jgi:hypothetical protein
VGNGCFQTAGCFLALQEVFAANVMPLFVDGGKEVEEKKRAMLLMFERCEGKLRRAFVLWKDMVTSTLI